MLQSFVSAPLIDPLAQHVRVAGDAFIERQTELLVELYEVSRILEVFKLRFWAFDLQSPLKGK